MESFGSLKNRTLSALIYSLGGLMTRGGLEFIFGIILARLLLPKDYGLLGMIMIFIAVSQIFVDSGMTAALIREQEVSNEDYSTVFYYNLLVSLLLYFLLFMSADAISTFFREPKLVLIVRVAGLNLIIGAFGLIQRTILVRNLDFKTQTIVEVIASVLSGVLAILAASKNYGVWALIIKLLSMQFFTSLLFMLHNKWIPLLAFNMSSFRRFFSFGCKLLLTGILATIYKNVYNIIIGRSYSQAQLGYYTKSVQFRDIAANSLTSSVEKVSYPVLSQLQADENRMKSGFSRIINMSSFVTFPIMIGMAATARPLISVLFGSNWIEMVPYFQLLCLSGTTFPHRALNLNILKVKGRSDIFLGLDILKIVVGLITIYFVILLNLGIFGLLWVVFFNTQFAFFVNSYYSGKFIGYSTKEQVIDMIPALSASIIMGLVVYLQGIFLLIGDIPKLILQIITGVIVYIVASKALKIKEFDLMLSLLKSILLKTHNK